MSAYLHFRRLAVAAMPLIVYRLVAAACLLSLGAVSGCASYIGMPSHGGGKRFATEQELIAASARAAIKAIDLPVVANHILAVTIVMMGDDGSGTLAGGRMGLDVGLRKAVSPSAVLGFGNEGRSVTYLNNGIPNPNDSLFFKTLVLISLRQRGHHLAEPPQATHELFVIVDVFGTVHERKDFQISNSESLTAKTKLEYSLFELSTKKLVTVPAVASFEATYRENYIVWSGPVNVQTTVKAAAPLLVNFSDIAVLQKVAEERAVSGTITRVPAARASVKLTQATSTSKRAKRYKNREYDIGRP
jgi:hypothetical protein